MLLDIQRNYFLSFQMDHMVIFVALDIQHRLVVKILYHFAWIVLLYVGNTCSLAPGVLPENVY